MQPAPYFSVRSDLHTIPENFWKRILNDEHLVGCDDLKKLVTGCEIIAALDELNELLAA
ncbi:MAG: hypothetical protein QOI34_1584 [Verrucomicrobiota bacterium]|jgi:hypothetical protein